jgi:hypothetical protein
MLQIESCDIRGNWEGGVALWQCGAVRIVDTEISGNHGSGLTASDSKLELIHATFRDNHGPSGGAVALTSTELTVARECFFQSNRADDGTGGGLFAESSHVHFLDCVFRQNTAAAGGGAVGVRDSSNLLVRSCFVAANRSSSGGAVLTDLSWLDLQLSIFTKNRATGAGSAVQVLGRRTPGVNPFISGNTFYRNGVDAQAGASVFAESVSPQITRNIFVIDSTDRNKAVLVVRGAARYECNLVRTMDGPAPEPSANMIVGDPLFCDPEKDDFHLHDLSPAILAPCGRIGPLGKGCSSFRLLPSR